VCSSWIPGRALTPSDLTDADNRRALAHLLRELHDSSVAELGGLPGFSSSPGAWRAEHAKLWTRIREEVAPRLPPAADQGLIRCWESLQVALDQAGDDFGLVHGDLGLVHIVSCERSGRPIGLIDFEYADYGDRAVDFIDVYLRCSKRVLRSLIRLYGRGLSFDAVTRRTWAYGVLGSASAALDAVDAGHDATFDGIALDLASRLTAPF